MDSLTPGVFNTLPLDVIRKLLGENLIGLAEIGAMCGHHNSATAAGWVKRERPLADARITTTKAGPIFWRPAVVAHLTAKGRLPGTSAHAGADQAGTTGTEPVTSEAEQRIGDETSLHPGKAVNVDDRAEALASGPSIDQTPGISADENDGTGTAQTTEVETTISDPPTAANGSGKPVGDQTTEASSNPETGAVTGTAEQAHAGTPTRPSNGGAATGGKRGRPRKSTTARGRKPTRSSSSPSPHDDEDTTPEEGGEGDPLDSIA
ncbi:hypothetical protein ACQEVF_57620 [Nonomuraea polychroma]|uniref:hypothetical protein n=1 Tax=Nonomuraea polychroma TaxID=46176 RepID=UPI003D9086CB